MNDTKRCFSHNLPMAQTEFTRHCHLGFMNPYCVLGPDGLVIRSSFAEILDQLPGPRILDLVGAVEIISRYHLFADRTLVEGVRRTPFMARPCGDCHSWEFASIPEHGKLLQSEESIANTLFSLLCEEALQLCGDARTIGILLSGGMDSRVAAAVVDHLVQAGQLSAHVVAFTWGIDESRDVHYAREVASLLQWDWVHLRLTPEDLVRNVSEAALRGCEYSPIHLHAMPQVRDIQGLDCVIAASYGDSIGRGEYSGRHITRLAPLSARIGNWFSLLNQEAYRGTRNLAIADLEEYRRLFHRDEPHQQLEIEQQAHYMRRMLNPCMSVINEQIPTLQLFTSPRVYGYMWSLAPSVRSNRVYKSLLEQHAPRILGIPWARTGVPYLSNSSSSDQLLRLHNRYGRWIREELHDLVVDRCLSESLARLHVFNMDAISSCLRWNTRLGRGDRASKLDELLMWLAALAECVEMYGITATPAPSNRLDCIRGQALAPLQVMGYQLARPLYTYARQHSESLIRGMPGRTSSA